MPCNHILLFLTLTWLSSCNFPKQPNEESSKQVRIDRAILLMSKIHAKCVTPILEKRGAKVDTISRQTSYLCLEIQTDFNEMSSDTTSVAVFFNPATGYKKEDPACEYAYSIIYIGREDHEPDFIEFGDNFYALSVEKYKQMHPEIDSYLISMIQNCDCVNPRIVELVKKRL